MALNLPKIETTDLPKVSTAATTNATANLTTPTEWKLDDKQTVQGQLSGILASNSPLLQQAQTKSLQDMNARGLSNSSMAIGAGQNALYSAALPIAQADANINATNAQTNTQIKNNSDATNTNILNSTSQFNAQASNTASQNAANASNQILGTQLDQNNKLQLADVEASYKTLMQTNSSAGELYQQAVKNITDITKDTALDSTAKQAAVNQQLSYLKDGLNMFGAINNLDLTKLLTF